jgi:hypothetical protein
LAAVGTRAGLLVAAFLACLVMVGGPYAGEAHACSCAGTGSTEEALRRSTAVFSGEVVEVEEPSMEQVEPTDPGMPLLGPVTFDVKAAWKGVSGESVVVHGQGPGAGCGLDFERGETYLVFAGGTGRGGDGPLETGLCSATRQTSEETARNMLGPPETLPKTGGVLFHSPGRKVHPAFVAATGVLALLAAGMLLAGLAVRRTGR